MIDALLNKIEVTVSLELINPTLCKMWRYQRQTNCFVQNISKDKKDIDVMFQMFSTSKVTHLCIALWGNAVIQIKMILSLSYRGQIKTESIPIYLTQLQLSFYFIFISVFI